MVVTGGSAHGFGAQPLEGGFSGETFLVEGPAGPAVLRIYGRDPQRAPVDAALLHLVRDLSPVPTVLDLHRADPRQPEEPAHLLTTFEPGRRLEDVLPGAGQPLRRTLAGSVADVLAALSGMPFLRPAAFADADLRLSEQAAPATDLVAWLHLHVQSRALRTWDPRLLRSLREVCAHADGLLDGVHRSCLVHSDFNPKNILVDPVAGVVTAVLDWEYAHAGSPYSDLGNLLRFERGSAWSHDVLEAFTRRVPAPVQDPLLLAYAGDLWALIDLAGRPARNRIVDEATRLLATIARTGDLAARPGPG